MLTRNYVQDQSVKDIQEHSNLILKWATGIGKTLAFIKMQEALLPKKVYIVVAETNHINNWKEDYKKHKKEHLLENVEIFCYHSLHKRVNTEVDLICLDEGHHVLTDKRMASLLEIKRNKLVLLSATITSEQITTLEYFLLSKFKTQTITLKQAINNNILPKPMVYIVPLDISKTELTSFKFKRGIATKRISIDCKYSELKSYVFNKDKYPNVDITVECTHYEKEDYLSNQIDYYKHQYFFKRQEFLKVKWLLLGSERKRFMAEAKTKVIKDFLPKILNKRFICFTGSIEQANDLSNNTNVIHSMISEVPSIISAFNNGDINHLFVVDMLREGQNLNNIEVGIVLQLDGNIGPFIQKMGRVLRAENPIIFVFYYKDTRDEEYYKKILEVVDPKHIEIVKDLNQLLIN